MKRGGPHGSDRAEDRPRAAETREPHALGGRALRRVQAIGGDAGAGRRADDPALEAVVRGVLALAPAFKPKKRCERRQLVYSGSNARLSWTSSCGAAD